MIILVTDYANDGILARVYEMSITKANFNWEIQMLAPRCFQVTHLSNYAVKSQYEMNALISKFWLGSQRSVTF